MTTEAQDHFTPEYHDLRMEQHKDTGGLQVLAMASFFKSGQHSLE